MSTKNLYIVKWLEYIMWSTKEKELNDLENKKKNIILDIKQKKKECHQEFYKENKRKIIILDIIMVLAILCNIGALILTNALVLKNNPDKTFGEMNPVMAKNMDIVYAEKSEVKFFGFLFNIFCWSVIVIYYINLRNKIARQIEYGMLLGMVICIFTAWSLDFFNDLGYWIGKLIYGGA